MPNTQGPVDLNTPLRLRTAFYFLNSPQYFLALGCVLTCCLAATSGTAAKSEATLMFADDRGVECGWRRYLVNAGPASAGNEKLWLQDVVVYAIGTGKDLWVVDEKLSERELRALQDADEMSKSMVGKPSEELPKRLDTLRESLFAIEHKKALRRNPKQMSHEEMARLLNDARYAKWIGAEAAGHFFQCHTAAEASAVKDQKLTAACFDRENLIAALRLRFNLQFYEVAGPCTGDPPEGLGQ